jgi:hypothetical protein
MVYTKPMILQAVFDRIRKWGVIFDKCDSHFPAGQVLDR